MNLLQTITATPSSAGAPKLTTEDFKIKNNYYVVTDGQVFSYYPIKVEPAAEGAAIFRFEKAPPLLLEGYAIVDKKIYKVPVQDLMRRVIRKSREINLEAINGTASTSRTSNNESDGNVPATAATTPATSTVQHQNEQRAGGEIAVEVSQAADTAWADQMRALLSVISEEEGLEEEWEIEDTP